MLFILLGFIYDLIFAGIPYQDPTPEMTQKYNVQGFPTILALKDGELNMKYDGDRSYESLLQFMNLAMTN